MLQSIQNFDIAVLQIIHHSRTELMNNIMVFSTYLGDAGIIWILMAISFLSNKKNRKVGFIAIISLIICALIVNIWLKPFVHRIRPFNMVSGFELLIDAPKDFSFPSGHTAASFTMVYVLFKNFRKYFFPVLILAIVISYSRMYLSVHYPSDVLAGIIIGLISGKLGNIVVNKFYSKAS